jgi:hypothetical protein
MMAVFMGYKKVYVTDYSAGKLGASDPAPNHMHPPSTHAHAAFQQVSRSPAGVSVLPSCNIRSATTKWGMRVRM